MKIRSKTFLIVAMFIILFISSAMAGFKGKISGTVVDAENGEPLVGANIYLENTALGASSDLDGHYVILNVPQGKYTLIFSVVGYAETRIKDVRVTPEKITKIDVALKPEILTTDVVEVEAKALHNTEASLLKSRQKSPALSDAVSAEAIAQSGAGNAADAMKQVTGASVVDGKYVYVRGLGDRYTSTQLNGAALPSTDPYKRSGSVDLIPSGMVDNIVTIKSFTPDKPGDFSGGIVDIRTKDYPDRFQLKFSSSIAYNGQANYNTSTLGYSGSSTDWLGFDDGSRALPKIMKDPNLYIPDIGEANADPDKAALLTKMTRSFNPQMGPVVKKYPINKSFAFSLGNQYQFFNRPLGIIASLTYKNDYSAYNNGIYRRWNQGTQEVMSNIYDYRDKSSKSEVLWGGLFKASYGISPNNHITLNAMYNRDAVSAARLLSGIYTYDSDANRTHYTSVLSYNERQLYSIQLKGEHVFPVLAGLRLNWQGSFGNSTEAEPDRRVFSYYSVNINDRPTYGIKDNLPPKRYYRDLNEDRKDFKMDLTLPFSQWSGLSSKIKIGGAVSGKQRYYSERLFAFTDQQGFEFDGNPNHLLADNNTGIVGYDTVTIRNHQYITPKWGVVVVENILPANNYQAEQNISAGYAMIDLPLFSKMRFIGGARLETTDMWLQTQDSTLDKGQINTHDLLPSANLIYNILPKMNLRFAFSRTLARPNFREIGPFATFDFDDGGDSYVGNPHLERTFVTNYDLRWEWFSRPGEIYAISGFYKDFQKPIERVFNSFGENTWKNVKEARAYGLELEMRKRLDVLHHSLSHFQLGANLSLIHSQVSIAANELELIRALRPEASATRPFQGQSPYLVNLNLSYENAATGISSSLYYNVFGKRLDRVSYGGTPDVYEKPAALLNFSFSWKFMKHLSLKFAANNLLNPDHTKYQFFKGKEYIYSQYKRGRAISLGLSYRF